MFKQPLKFHSRAALTRKEGKKFSQDISKFFNTESFETFIEENDLIISLSNYTGIPAKIYSSGNIALFIDSTGKGDYFPSIDLVQKCPDLAQSAQVKEGVDVLLKEGANVRWEDLKDIKGLGSFKKDDVRYIKSSDNQVIAIGAMACDESEAGEGVAMFVLHVVGDCLWNWVAQYKEGTIFAQGNDDKGVEKLVKKVENGSEEKGEEKKEPEIEENAEKVEKKESEIRLKKNGLEKKDEENDDEDGKKNEGRNQEDGEKIKAK